MFVSLLPLFFEGNRTGCRQGMVGVHTQGTGWKSAERAPVLRDGGVVGANTCEATACGWRVSLARVGPQRRLRRCTASAPSGPDADDVDSRPSDEQGKGTECRKVGRHIPIQPCFLHPYLPCDAATSHRRERRTSRTRADCPANDLQPIDAARGVGVACAVVQGRNISRFPRR